jgi:hypothetical protein
MTTGRITIRNAKDGDYSRCLPLLTLLYHGDIGTDFKNACIIAPEESYTETTQ